MRQLWTPNLDVESWNVWRAVLTSLWKLLLYRKKEFRGNHRRKKWGNDEAGEGWIQFNQLFQLKIICFSSVPPKRRSEPLPVIAEKPKSASAFEDQTKKSLRAKTQETAASQKGLSRGKENRLLTTVPNSISISRGSLKLSINFPADTLVKFDKKRMGQNVCKCMRLPSWT